MLGVPKIATVQNHLDRPDTKTTKGQKRNYLKILVNFYKLQIFLNIYHVYQLSPS